MFTMLGIVPRANNSFTKVIYSGVAKQVWKQRGPIFGHAGISDSGHNRQANFDTVCIEGIQGEVHRMSVTEAQKVLRTTEEYQQHGPGIQGLQGVPDANPFASSGHVSLNGCMQSTVPTPSRSSICGYQSYLNMPGAGNKLLDKYHSGNSQAFHQSRCVSTSASKHGSQQGAQDFVFEEEDILFDPTPQGIQGDTSRGDDCVQFKLWMENCQRYNLPNCDEQIESITSGRKTLAQVFQEQQEIIKLVVDNYKKSQLPSQHEMDSEINAQGQQDYFGYSFELSEADPCPQGLQGDDCANFKLWANNCHAFGFGNCDEKLHDINRGKRTLQDVFDEQDQMIKKIMTNYQQKRTYSTGSKPEVGKTDTASSNESSSPHSTLPNNENIPKLSQKDKLKRAVKEYGSTVIVFHIGISLISLGGFYVAVSSGLDVVGLLTKLGVGESILQSKIATGSTTFVVAYAVHKVFAPVRIGITLSCTPFIVRYLRRVGFLKPPKIKSQ